MLCSKRLSILLSCAVCLSTFTCQTARAAEAVLAEAPSYREHNGCTPTAGMIVMGYWDSYGYPGLIPGSNSWSTNESVILNAISSAGHIADYINPYDYEGHILPDMSSTDPAGAHANDSLADFMGTSRSALGLYQGATRSDMTGIGMEQYASYRGYSFNAGGDWTRMPTWVEFTSEIQHGRPVLLGVDKSGNAQIDHTVAAVGYRDTYGQQEYACYEGGNYVWHGFRPTSSYYRYSVGFMDTLRPAGTWDTERTASSGTWSNATQWSNGIPDADAFVHLPHAKTTDIVGSASARLTNNIGTLNISGRLTTGILRNDSTGVLNLTAGADVNASQSVITTGQASHTGGSLYSGGDVAVWYDGSSYTQSGGTLTAQGSLTTGRGGPYPNKRATFRLTGGTVNAAQEISVGGYSRFEWLGGSIQTPKIALVHDASVLAMGIDFSLAELAAAQTLNGIPVEASSGATIEIANGLSLTHDAGVSQLPCDLRVGGPAGSGALHIGGTGQLSTGFVRVGGPQADGLVRITGGGSLTGSVYMGSDYGENGIVEIENGRLSAKDLMVARYGSGTFRQSGGDVTVHTLHLGTKAGSRGRYELTGGTLETTSREWHGIENTIHGDVDSSVFVQSGGRHIFGNGSLFLDGTYYLQGGELEGETEEIGYLRSGRFVQTGGTNTCEKMFMKSSPEMNAYSSYELSGGQLTVTNFSRAAIDMSGGSADINDMRSTLTISGGAVNVNLLRGGLLASGGSITAGEFRPYTLEMSGSGVEITVTDKFVMPTFLGAIAPGSAIHMTGSNLENQHADPSAMGELANLELYFEGGAGVVDAFETASDPEGGFVDNFTFGGVILGDAQEAHVQLVDQFDNLSTVDSEWLSVVVLVIADGSSLDVNGLGICAAGNVEGTWDGWIGEANTGRLFDSSLATDQHLDAVYDPGNNWTTLTAVPEPATPSLLALGGLALIRRRKRQA